MEFKLLTRHTRAGCSGKVLKCPRCGATHKVFNFAWSDLGCPSCNAMINKYEWLVEDSTFRNRRKRQPVEALCCGFAVYVTSVDSDFWLSMFYLQREGEVMIIEGEGNLSKSRDFMALEHAIEKLEEYESNPQSWFIEVKH